MLHTTLLVGPREQCPSCRDSSLWGSSFSISCESESSN
jgi:hypothetical protein